MYTEYEVKELLEEAFNRGYDNGIDDTLDYIDENYELEDDSFENIDLFAEENILSRGIYAATKAKNFIQYRDPKQREIENRKTAATLGRIKAAINKDKVRNSVYGTDSTGRNGQIIDFRKEKEKVANANNHYNRMTRAETNYKEKSKSYVPKTQPKRKPVLIPRMA